MDRKHKSLFLVVAKTSWALQLRKSSIERHFCLDAKLLLLNCLCYRISRRFFSQTYDTTWWLWVLFGELRLSVVLVLLEGVKVTILRRDRADVKTVVDFNAKKLTLYRYFSISDCNAVFNDALHHIKACSGVIR